MNVSKYKTVDNFEKIKSIPCDLRIGNLKEVKSPVFSVVIPTYGRSDLLKETIDSILFQEDFHESYEIIVVDNEAGKEENATERLLRVLSIPNLYYYKNRVNIGGAGNWNRCISLARSKWVIMCHDDDLLKPECLATMKQILIKHSKDKLEVGYIRSSAEAFYTGGLKQVVSTGRSRVKKSKFAVIKFSAANVIWTGGATWVGAPTCGTLLNKDAVIAIGGYNQDLNPCFDCYVPYNMLGRYGVFKTCSSLGKYRWGENDTYKKTTLMGLIESYYEFLDILASKYFLVSFFKNEHFWDCVNYYRRKGEEADVEITDDEISSIHSMHHSGIKLKLLYLCRKMLSGFQRVKAH